jgi:hypothetical protein
LDGLKASYLEIEPAELVHLLLKESGQYERRAINPSDFLSYLKLDFVAFGFDANLPLGAGGGQPRALLSFRDRLIAVDEGLSLRRRRFSVLHEIGHYVLPAHQHSFYLCDSVGMSPWTRLTFEKEANEFAADLLFKGGIFAVDAAGLDISAKTVVALARKYGASFEATARRLVEKNLRAVMLVVFKIAGDATQLDADAEAVWEVRYCVGSAIFKSRFFARVTGNVPVDVASDLLPPGRDIEESITRDIAVSGGREDRSSFRAEFFYNQHNILCLLTPA